MTLAGLTWFLGTVSRAAVYLHRGPLVQLVVSHPTGRTHGRIARAFVVGAYLAALAQPYTGANVLTLTVAGGLVVFACHALLARRALVPASAALALAGAFTLTAVNRLENLNRRDLVLVIYDGVVAAVALGLTIDLLRRHRTGAAVRGLVVDLGSISGTVGLRDRLAAALGDPSLVLGYRLADTGALVDDAGQPLNSRPRAPAGVWRGSSATAERSASSCTTLRSPRTGSSSARLLPRHRSRWRTPASRQRRASEARELAESRRRIVESSDRERRRLAQDIHAGPERLLDDAAAHLATAAERNGRNPSDRSSGSSARHRRNCARSLGGSRPPALASGGLMPALVQLAEHSPIPVETKGSAERLPEAVEAALFFVCSEGLANAVKHSHATRVTIEVVRGERDGPGRGRRRRRRRREPQTRRGTRGAHRPRRGAGRNVATRQPGRRRHVPRRRGADASTDQWTRVHGLTKNRVSAARPGTGDQVSRSR